jgi:hypothetical protein
VALIPSQQLVDAIDALVGATNLTAASHYADLYEGYMWALATEAAAQLPGAAFTLLVPASPGASPAVAAPNPHQVVLRTSPGSMAWPSAAGYTHVRVDWASGAPFEIHLGAFVHGHSGSQHDCDLAVMTIGNGDSGRHYGMPSAWGMIALVESKHYTNDLPRPIGREFVWLFAEFWPAAVALSSNSSGNDVRRILTHHAPRSLFDDVLPGTFTETALTAWLFQAMRRFRR